MDKPNLLNKATNGTTVCKTGICVENHSTRIFKARNSLFTDLFENKHFSSIKHASIAMMILMFMYTYISDIETSGQFKLGFRYIGIGFGQFDQVIIMWTIMFLCALLMYPAFFIWTDIRFKLHIKFFSKWDQVALIAFLIYFVIFFYLPPLYTVKHNLALASSVVILAEQLRMLMKMHAYIRTNVPRIKSYNQHSENNFEVPGFNEYLYFLFVPTFIYKDEYPRTKEIRWSFVITSFLEMGAFIYLCSFMAANYIVPTFENYGLKPYSWSQVSLIILRMSLPSSVLFIASFYALLHSWMNAWAEMLKFADRLFYLDWWNSAMYSAFYRTENVIVRDYLHTFIYTDMYEIVVPGNHVLATCVVFWTSAIAHEYIIAFMLGGVFFPVLFVLFGVVGLLFHFVKLTRNRQLIGNVFLWWSILLGLGLLVSLYSMEYFARINCTKSVNSFIDYLLPYLLYCNKM